MITAAPARAPASSVRGRAITVRAVTALTWWCGGHRRVAPGSTARSAAGWCAPRPCGLARRLHGGVDTDRLSGNRAPRCPDRNTWIPVLMDVDTLSTLQQRFTPVRLLSSQPTPARAPLPGTLTRSQPRDRCGRTPHRRLAGRCRWPVDLCRLRGTAGRPASPASGRTEHDVARSRPPRDIRYGQRS